MSKPVSEFRKRLLELMTEKALNQTELAERTGIPNGTISRYLAGTQAPRADKIDIIARTFEVDHAWLLGYDVPQKRESLDYIMNGITIEVTDGASQRGKILTYAAKIAKLTSHDQELLMDLIDRLEASHENTEEEGNI